MHQSNSVEEGFITKYRLTKGSPSQYLSELEEGQAVSSSSVLRKSQMCFPSSVSRNLQREKSVKGCDTGMLRGVHLIAHKTRMKPHDVYLS